MNKTILILLGSVRPGNYTVQASNALAACLRTHGADVHLIDPATLTLADPGHPPTPDTTALQAQVTAADALVIATPEYHGSYSSVTKRTIENLGFPSTLANKPIALLGVAAGVIGAIKSLEHLRSVCAHVGAHVLPTVVSLAKVHTLFDDQGNCTDEPTIKRLDAHAQALLDHISA